MRVLLIGLCLLALPLWIAASEGDSAFLVGRLLGPGGEGLEGVEVRGRIDREPPLVVLTGPEGGFRLGPFPAEADCRVGVAKVPGYFFRINSRMGFVVRLEAVGETRHDLHLERAGIVTGRFVGAPSREGFDDLVVRVTHYFPQECQSPGIYHRGQLDREGCFRFDNLTPDLGWIVDVEKSRTGRVVGGPATVPGGPLENPVLLHEIPENHVRAALPAAAFTASTPRWFVYQPSLSLWQGTLKGMLGCKVFTKRTLTAERPEVEISFPSHGSWRLLAVALPIPEDPAEARILVSPWVSVPPSVKATVLLDQPLRGARLHGRVENRVAGEVVLLSWPRSGRGWGNLPEHADLRVAARTPVGEDGAFKFTELLLPGHYWLGWRAGEDRPERQVSILLKDGESEEAVFFVR